MNEIQQRIEKRKRKIFHNCLYGFKAYYTKSSCPSIMSSKIHPIIEKIRSNRIDIINSINLESIDPEDISAFQSKLDNIIEEQAINFCKEFLPEYLEDKLIINHILSGYALLEFEIKNKYDRIKRLYDRDKYKHWRGADVIVTSDEKYRQKSTVDLSGGSRAVVLSSRGDADFVLVTDNPKPIVWMLYQLRDKSSGYIDYGNKYVFYGNIVQAAKKILESGEDVDYPKLMLACLNEAKLMILEEKE